MSSAVFSLTDEVGADDVVAVTGEIDATNAADLARAADGAVNAGRSILDLSGVAYLDSAGFAVLDDLLARHTAAVVLAPGSTIRKAASLVGLMFHDDEESARATLVR